MPRLAYETLLQLAPTLDMTVDNGDSVGGVKTSLTKYGAIFGRQSRAAALTAALNAKVNEAREAATGRGTGLVVVTNGGRLGVYGPGSRVAWIYDALAIPNVFTGVDDGNHGGDAISAEYLSEKNPDWLFVVDRDAGIGQEGSARATPDNELIHGTTFWRKNQIVHLDPAAAYVTMHGVTGLMRLLDQVDGLRRHRPGLSLLQDNITAIPRSVVRATCTNYSPPSRPAFSTERQGRCSA